MSLETILKELEKRKNTRFVLSGYCFKEQIEFINDPARFKTAVCSRRAGKTEACAADLLWTAINNDESICLYITLSRSNAKRLIWPLLNRINRVFKMGGKPNESELSLTFTNGSVIYLSGAKDKTEIEKFRGLAIKKVYVDEAQSFRAYIQELIDEVLGATLFDYNGTVCMTGTPGPIPAGYFHDAAHSEGWSHHSWTMHVNPHIERKSGKKVEELISEELKRMKVDITEPKVQREYFARWVVDSSSLVFKYNSKLNHFEVAPVDLNRFVISVDIGHDDADAIAVIGWHDKRPEAYLVHEDIEAKQGITELADKIEALDRQYNPMSIVMDTGGLGKKIAEELRRRRSLPIEAAEKVRKFEHIEILNDSMRQGYFKARQDSAFAQDCFLVEYDRDKQKPDKLVISDRYHSDICDAALYGFRKVLTWLYRPEPEQPKPGTPEAFKKEEDDMVERMEEQVRRRQSEGFETADAWGDLDDGF